MHASALFPQSAQLDWAISYKDIPPPRVHLFSSQHCAAAKPIKQNAPFKALRTCFSFLEKISQ